MMQYKGYTSVVQYDHEAKIFHGEVVDTRAVITFQGTSVDEIEREFRNSIDVYLKWCAERGKEPEKPFSGNFQVRVEPQTHRMIALAAALADKSMNAWVKETLEHAAEQELETA